MITATITIQVSDVSFQTWMRTSYIAMSQISQSGAPLIDLLELGRDERDVFDNLVKEAANEILKIFASRQDNVIGSSFTIDLDGAITYKFSENTPILSNATNLKLILQENVKQALYNYVAFNWLSSKGQDYAKFVYDKYLQFCEDIKATLYLLHD